MKIEAQCFSFCYKLDDEDYEDEDGATWGLICTLNDEYLHLIDSNDLIQHVKSMKKQLELMIGKTVYVFNRQDSEYKIDLYDEDNETPLDV